MAAIIGKTIFGTLNLFDKLSVADLWQSLCILTHLVSHSFG